MRTFHVGDVVYHGQRYWKQEDLGLNEVNGWNVEYVPYTVTQITAKRIEVTNWEEDGLYYLNRERMERDGCIYHTKVHGYFFAEKPTAIGDYMGRVVEDGVVR